jgi:23S rRNA (uracil1939-C5)-methyltransferase
MESTITIESLGGHKGYGVGFSNDITVFVPNCVPGDVVKIDFEMPSKKRWIIVENRTLITPSEFRVKSICPHFSDKIESEIPHCGGCPWIVVDYKVQLKSKLSIVERAFKQGSKKLLKPSEIKELPRKFHYRNRIRLGWKNEILGFNEGQTNNLIDITDCKIFKNMGDVLILKEFLPVNHEGEIRLLWDKTDNLHIFVQTRARYPDNLLEKLNQKIENRCAGIIWKNKVYGKNFLNLGDEDDPLFTSASGFFQPGFISNSLIINTLEEMLENLPKDMDILEFYAGGGNITKLLVKHGKVTAIESDQKSWEPFSLNVKEKSVLLKKPVEKFEFNKTPDLLLMDPPRIGLSKPIMNKILKAKPKYIILISCDPMNGQRDLSKLLEAGYTHKSIKILDTMPQTSHMEIISLLEFEG